MTALRADPSTARSRIGPPTRRRIPRSHARSAPAAHPSPGRARPARRRRSRRPPRPACPVVARSGRAATRPRCPRSQGAWLTMRLTVQDRRRRRGCTVDVSGGRHSRFRERRSRSDRYNGLTDTIYQMPRQHAVGACRPPQRERDRPRHRSPSSAREGRSQGDHRVHQEQHDRWFHENVEGTSPALSRRSSKSTPSTRPRRKSQSPE